MSAESTGLTERLRRQVEGLLDEAGEATRQLDWPTVQARCHAVLAIHPANPDALAYLVVADRAAPRPASPSAAASVPADADAPPSAPAHPTAFVRGRYQVLRFLGEGAKKRVYLVHDSQLDRDVAFALLKSEGLDVDGLVRLRREAQAMGRLGDHPHIVTVHDIGEDNGQPYIVSQFMAGGDLAHLLAEADNHRLDWEPTLRIAEQVCEALEYAHREGVIHRDLKPGNVWLAAVPPAERDPSSELPSLSSPRALGPAKLGDFGLALGLDRSRMTQVGMVVGTVAYMAPEQALGSEVNARSDLYSLGAMLYELVTGRPPFIGDESVAIITQHLNTPPVAPSWHRPDCPPGLEALILRLLEKDPTKRPASAGEVREALRGVGASAAPTPTPPPMLGEGQEERTSAPDPLYRSTFVGREPELKQLQASFDASVSGQGALLMVVGEPGIGKTALCEQLATYVAVRGGKTLVGHCYEEGSLSLPYLAFVEALRTYVLSREPAELQSELGSGAAEVARIVSEVREKLASADQGQQEVGQHSADGPRLAGGPAADPEEERWRLFQAVTGFLRNAATVHPILLVLEDLHWADRGTLDLLLHVARNLQGARLLVVGTYRDVEVDRAHPLSATLADLRRIGSLPRVLLRGLTVDEVHRMYGVIRGQEVSWAQAEAVHRQTEGNPLFVQEVLRYLAEEGFVVREAGRWVLAPGTGPGVGIPEGLRDVVGRRLNRLSEQTNQLLSIAAVVGREFRLDVLQQVAGVPEEEVDAALQEAKERAILEERPALGVLTFRFTHAFFRQTLYEEIFASRRLRLHQQVARALESLYAPGGRPGGEQGAPPDRPAARIAGRLEEHASELAEHFALSTDPADLKKALGYSELAAKRALSVFAYGEAAQLLEKALKIQDVLDPDDKVKRCDLLFALGEAMLPMEEPRRVADTVAQEAFTLAESLNDSPRAARAAVQALEAFTRTVAQETFRWAEAGEWAIRADRHAQVGTVERIYADIAQGLRTMGTTGVASGHVFLRRAVERALDLGDNAAFFAAADRALSNLNALRDRELQERLAHEVLARPHEGVRSRDLAQCLHHAGPVLLGCGDRELAEEAWREEARLAERTRDTTLSVNAMTSPVLLALIDGRLEQGLSLREVQEARGQQVGVSAGPGGLWLARALLLLGQTGDLLGRFESPIRPLQAWRAVIQAHLGRFDEVRGIRERFGDVGSAEDESAASILVNLLEASIVSHDEQTTASLAARLAPMAGVVQTTNSGVSIGRLLGDGERLLGRPEAARGYYAQALQVCEKIRFRPEIALVRLAQAELLLDEAANDQTSRGRRHKKTLTPTALKNEAAKHLDFAIDEFTAMKMQPSLKRALALKTASG